MIKKNHENATVSDVFGVLFRIHAVRASVVLQTGISFPKTKEKSHKQPGITTRQQEIRPYSELAVASKPPSQPKVPSKVRTLPSCQIGRY